jgi:hypothetical protein
MKNYTTTKLREGENVLSHWVNQPQYVGDKLRVENCQFIRTTKDGLIQLVLICDTHHIVISVI